jgi:cytochrome oxidase Cu insertion factor (SCO1/SenC/PrrC family)
MEIIYAPIVMSDSNLLPSRPKLIVAAILIIAAFAIAALALTQWPTKGPMGSGTALIGGPFTMVNQKGETVTEKNFEGKYTIYFFGFTFCPDVCPTELQVLTAALKELGPDAAKITPVFVSVDPERDSPKIIGEYVANFDPRFVGLTGTPEQLAVMARAFHIYYKKVANENDAQNYGMDHPSILYLMEPDGKFAKHFPYTTDAKKLALELKSVLEASGG